MAQYPGLLETDLTGNGFLDEMQPVEIIPIEGHVVWIGRAMAMGFGVKISFLLQGPW
jgi:hypothetical protein